MQINTGMLIEITDEHGSVFGLDSKYAKDLVDKHGDGGVYVQKIGNVHDVVVTVSYYTEHESRLRRWKHNILEWMYQRQLKKALTPNSVTPSDTPIKTTSAPTEPPALYPSPLNFALQPPPVLPLKSDTTKPAIGSQDDASFADAFRFDEGHFVCPSVNPPDLCKFGCRYGNCELRDA